MKIKLKIFLGFFTLVLMLSLAAGYSIIEFTGISHSVKAMLDDNYKTIEASKDMLEALEREDSGILLLLMGQFKEGRGTIASSDSVFQASISFARRNLTETDEHLYVQQIEENYAAYRKIIELPIVDTRKEGNILWYDEEVYPSFQEVKKSINALIDLNHRSMYNEALLLKEKSKRAIMPAIVAIIAGIVFTMIFNLFINYYLVSPINRIIDSIRNFKRGTQFGAGIETHDEIRELEESIRNLTTRI